ncbi:MAG: hypothetical protein R2831_01130 [Chitinophagaceae bacterium]
MKKVLIISYYFPPCNLTPSERIYSWAKYLKALGYYPIIVTRNWDIEIKGFEDELKTSGTSPLHKVYDDYEVWYMPYKQSFKEYLYFKKSSSLIKLLYLLVSFKINFLQIFTNRFSNFYFLYRKAAQLIESDKGIKKIIVSAYPYLLFNYAYKLNKKYKIPWIADYRDDWTSNEILNKSKIHSILNKLNSYNEKKWLSSAYCFTTVSDFYIQKIQRVIGPVKGVCIENGYMKENYLTLENVELYEDFTVTYVGSLYRTQPIELFLEGVLKFIELNKPEKFKVLFVGLLTNTEAMERLKKYTELFPKYFTFTSRISKQEAIAMQYKSAMLLLCTHTNMKGTPGSKLYEYIALKKRVLITPGDGDIVENTLQKTGQGIVASTSEEVVSILEKEYSAYFNMGTKNEYINEEAIKKYDRFYQTKILADILNEEYDNKGEDSYNCTQFNFFNYIFRKLKLKLTIVI